MGVRCALIGIIYYWIVNDIVAKTINLYLIVELVFILFMALNIHFEWKRCADCRHTMDFEWINLFSIY